MSDLLAVEAILHLKRWNLKNWSKIYTELPNRQLKVKVKFLLFTKSELFKETLLN